MHDAISLFLFMIAVCICCSSGSWMEKKMMMKWMMDKSSAHEESKGGISLGFKAVAIPIPIPIITKEKGDSKPEKPWAAESKDMFWKMMMMKMMKGGKGKGGQGKASAMVMCCPQQMQMQNGWPMMMMKAKMKSMMMKAKAQPMCCPQMVQAMANAGWDNAVMMKGMSGCSMMNGGWPPPSMNMMCCSPQNGGGWPDEEPEEEPDYYEEEPMMGWDTKNTPDYALPDETIRIKSNSISRIKGDRYSEGNLNSRRTAKLFRKGLRIKNNYEYDFD